MNREIKFRVWVDAIDAGKMIYPEWIKFNADGSIESTEFLGGIPMQYTGFKDSTRKEIYEGDIIKFTHLPPFETTNIEIGKVYWDICEGAWCVKVFGDKSYETFLSGLEMDIIGNIFENGDLIDE
jgi:uncharacterized phage protein (TIGR01671 family)